MEEPNIPVTETFVFYLFALPFVFYGPEMEHLTMSSWESKATFIFILHAEAEKGNDTNRFLQGLWSISWDFSEVRKMILADLYDIHSTDW